MISANKSGVEGTGNSPQQRVTNLISAILEEEQLLDESREILEELMKSDRDLKSMTTEELQGIIMEALR